MDQVSVSASFLFSEGVSDEARDGIDSETLSGVFVVLFF